MTRPAALSTAAIGSLPHTQLELAIQQALRLDIPTLPQLPRADAAEFMLAQALEGLPGLRCDAEGHAVVDVAAWRQGARAFGERLERALQGAGLASFEPSGTHCLAWKPFLWEVETCKAPFAKAQLAGPLTSTWATTLSDGAPLSTEPELSAQVLRLVLVRALAMTAALKATGAQPIVFLDEPGLFAFDKRRPTHQVEMGQLSIVVAALQRAGAQVGVHSCGNTDWSSLLRMGLDYVSADVRLSLASILQAPELDAHLAGGGRLALGVVPTSTVERVEVPVLLEALLATLGDRREAILSRSILTPACGLALHAVPHSEQAYADLREMQRRLRG